MEGMVASPLITIQQRYLHRVGARFTIQRWATGFITKLLEATHGQWLYRNIVVHDAISGDIVSKHKQELQMEIERQRELGDAELLPADQYLAEVNLTTLETTTGEKHAYWLLAIKVARKAWRLRTQLANRDRRTNTSQ